MAGQAFEDLMTKIPTVNPSIGSEVTSYWADMRKTLADYLHNEHQLEREKAEHISIEKVRENFIALKGKLDSKPGPRLTKILSKEEVDTILDNLITDPKNMAYDEAPTKRANAEKTVLDQFIDAIKNFESGAFEANIEYAQKVRRIMYKYLTEDMNIDAGSLTKKDVSKYMQKLREEYKMSDLFGSPFDRESIDKELEALYKQLQQTASESTPATTESQKSPSPTQALIELTKRFDLPNDANLNDEEKSDRDTQAKKAVKAYLSSIGISDEVDISGLNVEGFMAALNHIGANNLNAEAINTELGQWSAVLATYFSEDEERSQEQHVVEAGGEYGHADKMFALRNEPLKSFLFMHKISVQDGNLSFDQRHKLNALTEHTDKSTLWQAIQNIVPALNNTTISPESLTQIHLANRAFYEHSEQTEHDLFAPPPANQLTYDRAKVNVLNPLLREHLSDLSLDNEAIEQLNKQVKRPDKSSLEEALKSVGGKKVSKRNIEKIHQGNVAAYYITELGDAFLPAIDDLCNVYIGQYSHPYTDLHRKMASAHELSDKLDAFIQFYVDTDSNIRKDMSKFFKSRVIQTHANYCFDHSKRQTIQAAVASLPSRGNKRNIAELNAAYNDGDTNRARTAFAKISAHLSKKERGKLFGTLIQPTSKTESRADKSRPNRPPPTVLTAEQARIKQEFVNTYREEYSNMLGTIVENADIDIDLAALNQLPLSLDLVVTKDLKSKEKISLIVRAIKGTLGVDVTQKEAKQIIRELNENNYVFRFHDPDLRQHIIAASVTKDANKISGKIKDAIEKLNQHYQHSPRLSQDDYRKQIGKLGLKLKTDVENELYAGSDPSVIEPPAPRRPAPTVKVDRSRFGIYQSPGSAAPKSDAMSFDDSTSADPVDSPPAAPAQEKTSENRLKFAILVVNEIIDTENSFRNQLLALHKMLVSIPHETLKALRPEDQALLNRSAQLLTPLTFNPVKNLPKLSESANASELESHIAHITNFLRHSDALPNMSAYVIESSRILKLLTKLVEANVISDISEYKHQSPTSLAISPIQRPPRYRLLLEDLNKKTPDTLAQAKRSLSEAVDFTKHANDTINAKLAINDFMQDITTYKSHLESRVVKDSKKISAADTMLTLINSDISAAEKSKQLQAMVNDVNHGIHRHTKKSNTGETKLATIAKELVKRYDVLAKSDPAPQAAAQYDAVPPAAASTADSSAASTDVAETPDIDRINQLTEAEVQVLQQNVDTALNNEYAPIQTGELSIDVDINQLARAYLDDNYPNNKHISPLLQAKAVLHLLIEDTKQSVARNRYHTPVFLGEKLDENFRAIFDMLTPEEYQKIREIIPNGVDAPRLNAYLTAQFTKLDELRVIEGILEKDDLLDQLDRHVDELNAALSNLGQTATQTAKAKPAGTQARTSNGGMFGKKDKTPEAGEPDATATKTNRPGQGGSSSED